jgi:hypothetical protein
MACYKNTEMNFDSNETCKRESKHFSWLKLFQDIAFLWRILDDKQAAQVKFHKARADYSVLAITGPLV